MKRSTILLIIIAIAVIGLALYIGSSQRKIYVTIMPESLICQPFRSPNDMAAQQRELDRLKAHPVMDQMLLAAFKAQSRGDGELLQISNFVCSERIGNTQSARAKTFYYVSKK